MDTPRIGITLDTYSHVLPTMQNAAADKLDQLIVTTRARGRRGSAQRSRGATIGNHCTAPTESTPANKEIGYS